MPPVEKLLSLIIPGRNDSYMGDFKWRLGMCMDYLARSLKEVGRLDDVEVLIVDWNSDVPLHEEMELSPDAASMVRFVIVPPAIARPAQKDSPFPIPIAQNVGIRRARGEYIAQTDSEILYTPSTVRALFDVLDGRVQTGVDNRRALLVSGRRHLPFQWALRKPALDEIGDYLNRNAGLATKEPLFAGLATPSALALMHRSMWLESGAYDEQFIYWGWMEIDLYLRITQRFPWRTLDNFGVNLIHIEHYRQGRDKGGQQRKENPTPVSLKYVANDEHWGLANEALTIETARKVREPAPPPQRPLIRELRLTRDDFARQFGEADTTKMANDCFQGMKQTIVDLGPEERQGMELLGWYAKQFNPGTYFEFGLRAPFAAGLVWQLAPAVEIYGIDTWQAAPRWPYIPPFFVPNLLRHVGYSGYCRVITGDPATAVQRWWDSTGTPVDLALIRAEMPGGHVAEQACELLKHLAPGGGAVIVSQTPAGFSALTDVLVTRFPELTFVKLKTGLAGIFLAAKFAEPAK
jgi:hypothetical protein